MIHPPLGRGALAAALLVVLCPLSALAAPPDRSEAPYFHVHGERGEDALPLKATETRVDIAGVIAHVKVRQVWANEGTRPLHTTYVFPGSTRAAVFAMRMRIGERVLEAEIEERARARETFEAARREGRTASLLEQQRPNVFTMEVANVLPGDRIEVELDYTELLVPEEGTYELVIPQVVGPRYTNDGAEAWTQNPYLAGEAGGSALPFEWKLDVALSAGMGIAQVGSPSHALAPRYTSATALELALRPSEGDLGGDRDFVLRYRLRKGAIETGLLLFRDQRRDESAGDPAQGYFLLLVEPPARVPLEEVPPREVIFVVDTSGSMHGYPLDTVKALFARLAADLRPQDSFNILFFAGGSFKLAPKSLPATRENLARAEEVLRWQQGGGATRLDLALDDALALPREDAKVSRTFLVLTDGYVDFERALFAKVRERLSDANLFVFGIGTSVNRHLVEGLARAGLGEPFFALSPEEAPREAARFARLVSRPALSDVQLRFEGFDAFDLEPASIPDLFAERPLVLFGRFRGPSAGRVRLSGTTGSGRFSRVIEVDDSKEREAHGALRYLWARERIRNLVDFEAPSDDVKAEVTRLGLAHHLVTPFTSFVAVDDVVRNASGDGEDVAQPLPLPKGVSTRAAGETAAFQTSTVVDFSDVGVHGDLTQPDGQYIKNRKQTKHRNLIEVRSSFRDRMEQDGAEAFGLGGLGATGSGFGAGGGGVGSGSGLGAGRGRGAVVLQKGRMPMLSAGEVHAEVSGSLGTRTIAQVMARSRKGLRSCYERALKKDPKLAGKLVVRLEIDATGRVKSARLTEDTVGSQALARCVLLVLERPRYPAPAGGGDTVVSYPLVFKPDG